MAQNFCCVLGTTLLPARDLLAICLQGKQSVGVETKPKPLLTDPNDVIIKVPLFASAQHLCAWIRVACEMQYWVARLQHCRFSPLLNS